MGPYFWELPTCLSYCSLVLPLQGGAALRKFKLLVVKSIGEFSWSPSARAGEAVLLSDLGPGI